jgi:GntR family transcriptional regulator
MSEHTSRSQQLHEALTNIIRDTKPGGKLLTEPELAKKLGVSRATLREAMRTFETQGLIRRRQGSGTYVVHPSHVIETGLEVLESIDSLAKKIGLKVEPGELHINLREAQEDEIKALELAPGSRVIDISRIILADGGPVAYLTDILPEDVLSVIELQNHFTGSVLDLLLERGKPDPVYSRTEINAVNASGEVARALGIQRGDVLLRFIAYLCADSGRVLDYSYSYFLPGYFRFHVIRRIG